jgi:hypothetical protein
VNSVDYAVSVVVKVVLGGGRRMKWPKHWVNACSISKDGNLFLFGKLGTDNTRESPEYIDKFTATSVACGAKHIVVLTDEGDVYGWGCNIGSIEQSFQSIPMHVKIPEAIKLISCGTSHTLGSLRIASAISASSLRRKMRL